MRGHYEKNSCSFIGGNNSSFFIFSKRICNGKRRGIFFKEIKLFDGFIALDYSGFYTNDEYCFELKEIESETTIILSHGCYGEFCDSGEKIIFSINNEDFVADSVYSFVVKQNGITVMNREFTASEVMATVPEFTNSEYYINELEEKDMTEEILVPVDFDETLVLLSMYENSSVGESKSIIDIEGLVIKTRERGWFEHALKDSNGNTFDKAKFCVNKNIPNSFPDALKLSFKKYMIGAEESLQFIGVIPSMIIGPIAFPFLLIGFIVTFPFQII